MLTFCLIDGDKINIIACVCIAIIPFRILCKVTMQLCGLICRTLPLPNALKLAESAKRKVREGSASESSTSSRGESRKRKRSALEEIRMVSSDLQECVDT